MAELKIVFQAKVHVRVYHSCLNYSVFKMIQGVL